MARLPPAIYALGATSLLNDVASEMIHPLLPLYVTVTLGATAVALGLIEGGADALASVMKLGSGWLSDRMGRRKPLVVAGYIIAGASRPLVALARGTGLLFVVRLLDRLGKGLRASPRDALIAELTPRELHGRAFGVHEAMDHAGAVIGPLVAYALLMAGLGLRSVFLLAALPAVAACLVVGLAVRDAPPAPPAVRSAPAAPPAALLSRPFVAYLGAVTLFALGNSTDLFLLLLAHDAGLPPAAAPLLWAVHHAVKSLVSVLGGSLSDRIGRRRALAMGWLVYAGIYAGFAHARSGPALIGLFVAYGLYFGLVGGAQKALVAEVVPPASRARGFGAYHLCVGLGALVANLLFGLLYREAGPRLAFLTGAGLALLAALVLPLSRPGQGREQRQEVVGAHGGG